MSVPMPDIARVVRCFLPFAAGYFLSYAFRAVNAAIGPDLARDTGLDPSALGAITSVYFVTFALSQIPIGVALDRWGPQRTEAVLLCFAAFGAFVFARAEDASGLLVGRALIGFGVAACLMAAFKANTLYWPIDRLPLANGLLMGFGGLGAASATLPVEHLLTITDWRDVIDMMAVATLVVALAIRILPTDPPRSATAAGAAALGPQLRAAVTLLTEASFWRFAGLTALTHGTYLAYQTLWAGPWLRAVAGATREEAAIGMALVTGAMALGYPVLGAVADRLAARGYATEKVFAVYAAIFVALEVPLAFGWSPAPLAHWAAFGFFGCGTVLGYAALTQLRPRAMAGRVNATVNLVVFLFAFVVQWGVGGIVAAFGPDSPAWIAHTTAMAGATGLQAAALLWFIRGIKHAEPRA
jgi:MFS family permease